MIVQNNSAASGRGESITSATEAAPVASQYKNTPDEYWAMPGPGRELQGLKRGALYSLLRDREIESIVVLRRGKKRGRRLIVASSLLAYLHRLRKEQCAPASVGREAAK